MDVNFPPSQTLITRFWVTCSGGDSVDRDCGDAGDGDDGGGGDHRRRVLTAAFKIKPRRVQ